MILHFNCASQMERKTIEELLMREVLLMYELCYLLRVITYDSSSQFSSVLSVFLVLEFRYHHPFKCGTAVEGRLNTRFFLSLSPSKS